MDQGLTFVMSRRRPWCWQLIERGEPRREDGKAHPGRRQLDHFTEVRSFVVCIGLFLKLSTFCGDFTCVIRCRYLGKPIDDSAVAMWTGSKRGI